MKFTVFDEGRLIRAKRAANIAFFGRGNSVFAFEMATYFAAFTACIITNFTFELFLFGVSVADVSGEFSASSEFFAAAWLFALVRFHAGMH